MLFIIFSGGGAVGISTACVSGNGRGVSRIKTGNQTGDCPALVFRRIKAFRGAAEFDFRSIFSKIIKGMG